MNNVDKSSSIQADMLKKFGNNEKASAKAKNGEMNKDMFLNLLVTQMQYQDPLEPTKNEDFLAQMAQFSALEQMKNLNTGFMMQQGNSLIGKVVEGKYVDENTTKTVHVAGEVKSVKLQDGEVMLQVQDEKGKMHELKLNKVDEVGGKVDDYLKKNSLDKINETLAGISTKIDTLSEKVEKIESVTEKKVEDRVEKVAYKTETNKTEKTGASNTTEVAKTENEAAKDSTESGV